MATRISPARHESHQQSAPTLFPVAPRLPHEARAASAIQAAPGLPLRRVQTRMPRHRHGPPADIRWVPHGVRSDAPVRNQPNLPRPSSLGPRRPFAAMKQESPRPTTFARQVSTLGWRSIPDHHRANLGLRAPRCVQLRRPACRCPRGQSPPKPGRPPAKQCARADRADSTKRGG